MGESGKTVAIQTNGRATAPGAVSVEIQNVSMVYERRGGECLTALEKVSISIAPGEFLAVVGPSGCGKSTLLMVVGGLLRARAGRVIVNGEVVQKPYRNVGIVFQKDVLLEWRTVLRNVLLPMEVRGLKVTAYEERARHLLETVGLQGFESRYPDELSGGMRQRVAICRALVHHPSLLLMDEPFGALDALTREKLNLDMLRVCAEEPKTVLFITHSIEEAVLMADQLVVMTPRPGRVLTNLRIDLPKPRSAETRHHPRFHQYVEQVRDTFHSMGIL